MRRNNAGRVPRGADAAKSREVVVSPTVLPLMREGVSRGSAPNGGESAAAAFWLGTTLHQPDRTEPPEFRCVSFASQSASLPRCLFASHLRGDAPWRSR